MATDTLVREVSPVRGLDLNKLIKMIEKYLGKDLRFSFKEFRQLKLLREDVHKLEEILSHPSIDMADLIKHYIDRSQELARFSERIERRLNVWIKRLETLITAEEYNLTSTDRQYFESWKRKIEICRFTLNKILGKGRELLNLIDELHNLTNKDNPVWKAVIAKTKEIKAKINEALGNNLHPGIRTLIKLFMQLEQAEERLGKYEFQEITPEEKQERLAQLKEWGYSGPSKLEELMISHWNITLKIQQSWNLKFYNLLFSYALPRVAKFIQTDDDLQKIGLFLAKNPELSATNIFDFFLHGVETQEELFVKFKEYRGLIEDKRYWTVQGLNTLGFLCVHVTNAFGGGVVAENSAKEDPFKNIESDIKNRFDYNPSISVMGRGDSRLSLVISHRAGINLSVGVVYDYGYIYESYPYDLGPSAREIGSKKLGINRRTGDRELRIEPALILNYPMGKTRGYNEFLIRNWTVSGIFYIKGCKQQIIDRLKQLSDNLSFKKYLNGKYLYRLIKIGPSKHIEKIFPVYEINMSNNTWKIVYVPVKK